MSKTSLLNKAREILAHPKQGPLPKTKSIGARDNQVPMIEPVGPILSPGGSTSPHAAPSASAPVIKNIELQPAAPNPRPVYWETGTGHILGPAVPEFLARDGDCYWIVTIFEGEIRWINADRLRSRKAFEQQVPLREVALIRF